MLNQRQDYEYKNDVKKKNNLGIVIVFVVIIIVLIISIFVASKLGYINLDFEKSSNAPGLQYTDVNTKIKEGIYITDVSEVVENVMPSIVSITSKTLINSGIFSPDFFDKKYTEGAGSGIIVSKSDEELLILTNNHVVEGASELSVSFINNKNCDAKIKGTYARKDVAVISVSLDSIDKETLNSIKLATIGNSNELKVGNGIIAIGNALGYGQSVTTGVVSAINRTISGDTYNNKMIQIDAAINGGNSGGALLNNKGEVVGINSAKYSNNASNQTASIEGMGFAIPISDVEAIINDLIAGKTVSNGMMLGISGYMTNTGYISGYDLPAGFYVSKIESGSNADKSELEIGNIITEIDGIKVESINSITDVLLNKKSGDSVKLKVKYTSGRTYKEKILNVKLK